MTSKVKKSHRIKSLSSDRQKGVFRLAQLIIAEKPNLALNIISALGRSQFQLKDGFAQSDAYVVTWAFGHLFELMDLEDYLPSKEEPSGWKLEGLPFCPPEFLYTLRRNPKTKKPDSGVQRQFQVIQSLLSRKDVTSVIHAGDADREGEIIIRTLLKMAKNRKPVYRLWIPAQTAEDIQEGLRQMEPDAKYDCLAQEGYTRSYVDWLFGINLTRAASIHSGTLLRVGRVIVPIVKAIYDRDMAIQNFKPDPYLIVVSEEKTNGEPIRLACKTRFAKDDQAAAEALASLLNQQTAIVEQVSKEEKVLSAGKLFNQSKLQAAAGKKFKLSPKETLDIAQKLYENGYTTYPRTSSEYLATSERGKTNRIVALLANQGYQVAPKDSLKSIYDDSKIESHSAITPTNKFPAAGSLNAKEQQIYNLILSRFLAVFCAVPCTVQRATMVIRIGDQSFTLKGDVISQRGWMLYEDGHQSEKVLPLLSVGDVVHTRFRIEERKTKPPAHYTVETLGNYLRNPFRQERSIADQEDASDDLLTVDGPVQDDEEYAAILSGLEIGTEATRAGIIDRAIQSGYIALKNNQYRILPGGIYYIEALWKMGMEIDANQTATLGRMLKKVHHGELSVQDVTDYSMKEIHTYFEKARAANVALKPAEARPSYICNCPVCGGEIREGKKGYYCSNYQTCSLRGLWKNACYVQINPKDVVALLSGATISKSYQTKQGTRATKKLRYDLAGGKILDVTNEPMTTGSGTNGKPAEVLKCPLCGDPIIERPSSYSCSNHHCKFVLWKETKYFHNRLMITPAKAKALLSGKHAVFQLTNRQGKPYNGYLKLKINGSYINFEPDGYPAKKGGSTKNGVKK